MARVERKSALAKAPAMDVVAALTTNDEPIVDEPATGEAATAAAPTPVQERKAAAPAPAASEERSREVPSLEAEGASQPAVRRGPGRPRSRRRMEPFSSKIDIELRDRVDEYIAEHDTTIVDLLDEALRAKIAEK